MNIAVQIAQTRAKIVSTINESGLPASVVELILAPIASEVALLAERERTEVNKNGEEEKTSD